MRVRSYFCAISPSWEISPFFLCGLLQRWRSPHRLTNHHYLWSRPSVQASRPFFYSHISQLHHKIHPIVSFSLSLSLHAMRTILWPSPHTEIENCCRIYPLSWFPEFDYWPEAQTRKVMCLTCVWYESGHIYTANVISSLQWKGDWKPDPICTVHQCSQTKEPIYEKESFFPRHPKTGLGREKITFLLVRSRDPNTFSHCPDIGRR